MKRFLILVTLLMIAVLTACGSPTQPATAPVVQPATEPPAAISAPAESGTEVTITLKDNTIESSLTEFKVGVPYTFVITNHGRHAHNLNISTPVSVAGSLDAAAGNALLKVDQDRLSPGATMTVEFTFPDSAAGQQLEFSCLIKRHYEDKMYLAISVAK